jgi:hypothetical protein
MKGRKGRGLGAPPGPRLRPALGRVRGRWQPGQVKISERSRNRASQDYLNRGAGERKLAFGGSPARRRGSSVDGGRRNLLMTDLVFPL